MHNTDWQRARTDEKKNERKEAIYQAAFTLFQKNGYDKVSFNGIATEAGFTKSNMYRYFSSKEEIFLDIFADLFEEWSQDCGKRLQELEENEPIKNFAKTWVESLSSFPKFLDLTPMLFNSLETNSSFENLCQFKGLAMKLLYGLSLEISRVYPELQGEKAFHFLNLSHAACTSYWTKDSESEALKKLYQLEEFSSLKPHFKQELTASLEIILLGLQHS